MANEYASMAALEVDGKSADVISIKPLQNVFRERVKTMKGNGFVKKMVEYGLTVEVAENNNFSKNPFWENLVDGTIVIVNESTGARETYPNATCLSADHSGYSVDNGASKFTYEFMTDKPSKI